MALQQFRDKQKLIYWIVAPVVIVSFVLLGFTDAFNNDGRGGAVGMYFGKKCSLADFEQFNRRQFSLFHQPTFIGTVGMGGQFRPYFNQFVSSFVVMAMAEDARRHGVQVTDDEVGTFIRSQIHYTGNNVKEFRERLQREITAKNLHFNSITDYQQTVRENLLARKFLALVDDSIIVPNSFAEITCAQQRAEYAYKRAFVPSVAQKEAAAKEFSELPEAEQLSRVEAFITANQTPAKRYQYAYLWEQPRWKIDFIQVPLAVPGLEPKITGEKVEAFFAANKNQYVNDKGEAQELTAVREKVEADLRASERLANAQNTIKREYEAFLRRHERNMADAESAEVVKIEDVNADPTLAKLALKAGTSGAEAKTAEEIFAAPELKDFAKSGPALLAALDRQATTGVQRAEIAARAEKNAGNDKIKEAKDKALEEVIGIYRKNFRGQAREKNSADAPLVGENGLLKVRVAEYIPGAALALRGADGKINDKLLAAVKDALVERLTMDKTQARAAAVAAALKENKAPEGIEVKDETTNAMMMQMMARMGGGAVVRLHTAQPGGVLEPSLTEYPEKGYEVLQLVSVKIPDAASLAAQTEQMQKGLSQSFRSNLPYAPENVMTAFVWLGSRGASYLNHLLQTEQLVLGSALDDNDAE